ncbi:MAG: hypothetical protein ACYC56_11095 [Candidatus Aquicultor sp.]
MNKTLPEKVIEEIKKQGIEPRPRWQFLLKRWVLWSLAIFSTILGGIAIAIIIFTFIDHEASVRVYLKQSAVEDILSAIPYFWFATLVILTGVTKYAVRNTKFGYRYAMARIVAAVLIGSIFFGITFNTIGVGESVQDFLVETVPSYDVLTYTSKDAWSQPEKGLLGGTVTTIISSEEFELVDFHKKSWRVNTSEIQGNDDLIIRQGAIIKIIGTQKDSLLFRAGQVFPWNN